MPKTEGMIWQFFESLPQSERNSGYKTGKCKFCGANYVSNAARMTKHLVNHCQKAPDQVKALFSSGIEESSENISTQAVSKVSKSKGEKNNINISEFFDKMSIDQKAKLDALFSQAIYASGAPLSMFENHCWEIFFKQLRPAYKLPTRYQLSNPLLESKYQEVHTSIIEKIQLADSLALMSDGWTDINGTALINILFATPVPVFWTAVEKKDNAATGFYISHILGMAIREVGEDKVHAVVTDNASNMKLAWELLTERFPHLITYGCCSHGVALIIKDILSVPTIKKIFEQAKDIINFFRNRQLPRETLKKTQHEVYNKTIALHQPVETRWGSHYKSLQRLLISQEAIKMAIMYREVAQLLPTTMKRNILDEDYFWKMILNISKLIEQPSVLINDIEGDRPNLSYFPMKIIKIFEFLNDSLYFLEVDEEDLLKQKFSERQNFLTHPVQLAAHLLNPKLRDEPLDERLTQQALDFIWKQSKLLKFDTSQIFTDVADYVGKGSIWSNQLLWDAAKDVEPVLWWKGYCSHRELTKLAIIILNLPSSSAACERNWSTYASIKTKKRNRLTVERANKLVAIKYNLQLLEPKNEKSKKKSRELEVVPLNARELSSDEGSDDSLG